MGFSYSKNMTNYEAFCRNISSSCYFWRVSITIVSLIKNTFFFSKRKHYWNCTLWIPSGNSKINYSSFLFYRILNSRYRSSCWNRKLFSQNFALRIFLKSSLNLKWHFVSFFLNNHMYSTQNHMKIRIIVLWIFSA